MVSPAVVAQRGAAQGLDLTHAVVVTSDDASPQESAAAELLLSEQEKRTGISWKHEEAFNACGAGCDATIFMAESARMPALLSPALARDWNRMKPLPSFEAKKEGFTVRTFHDGHKPVVIVAGNDQRGVLYGVGYLLRKMEMTPGRAVLPGEVSVAESPDVATRSHQIGYRFKNNTYDAWTLPMFEQQIRDLAVFGISGLQLIAPNSDDELTSPLFPAPALETVVGISRLLDKYGLDCDLYYPEMRKDYTDATSVADELKDFSALVQAMPRIDALYVPGGDPGHTAPAPLFALVGKEAEILQRYHPGATVWISAQGFDRASFTEFYRILQQERPAWLTGVFFGPQSRDSFEVERAHIPQRYALLFYPDIAHTMHAQFPVPQWDPIFALTEGREPIDPRPVDETLIYRHFARLNSGFVTYSEGVNDDVNKFLWTRLGWSQRTAPQETLLDYSRYFLGAHMGKEDADSFAQVLMDLEQDWRGPLLTNQQIRKTAARLAHLNEEASEQQRENWRFESALYRSAYDSYLQCKRGAELQQQKDAMVALALAERTGSAAAMDKAEQVLQPAKVCTASRDALEDLAGRLFAHVKLQLSVTKYGASGVERGANLDRADIPLNDRLWLTQKFDSIRALPTEADRHDALHLLAHWADPVPGSLYDDLGQPEREPHLVRGEGFAADPELYHTAIDGVADRSTADGWRLSDLTYAETLYETPLTLQYQHLNPALTYRLRFTYAGEDYALPLTLVANGRAKLFSNRQRRSNPETVEIEVPVEETKGGSLTLTWMRPDGLGGSGRGRQIAEVWLLPAPRILRAAKSNSSAATK